MPGVGDALVRAVPVVAGEETHEAAVGLGERTVAAMREPVTVWIMPWSSCV